MTKKTILYPVVSETEYYPNDYFIESEQGKIRIAKGTLLSFNGGYISADYEMVENKVFEDTLTYDSYGRGRSSAVFYFKGSDQAQYPMFMSDMDELLKSKSIIDGNVTGKWTFCKKGSNFGIKLIR